MNNEQVTVPTDDPAPDAPPPLVLLAADDDATCTDEVCLPVEARP